MIKKTLYFGNPSYLSISKSQLMVRSPNDNNATIPVEDIGVLVLDHPQITLTQSVLKKLLGNNAAVITCNDKHMPDGLFLPLDKHHTQTENFRTQLAASLPLKKQLWGQTIIAKVKNQHSVLKRFGLPDKRLKILSQQVKSGDSENVEGQAAAYYWKHVLSGNKRHRFGDSPNHLFNYGYAILRAIVARGLVSSGMLPTIGIHHRNKYNAYCLADDIMEPYRPIIDELIIRMDWPDYDFNPTISKQQKMELLSIPVLDVEIESKKMPLMIGVSRTTASLFDCFAGTRKKIVYPNINV